MSGPSLAAKKPLKVVSQPDQEPSVISTVVPG